jgi:hypothetical protein
LKNLKKQWRNDLKLWVARDSNGELWAYNHKPIKKDGIFQSDFELAHVRRYMLKFLKMEREHCGEIK